MSSKGSTTPSSDNHSTSSCCSASTFLGAVSTTFAFFFLVIVLFLYARYLLLHRRRHRRHQAAEALDDEPPPPEEGLDPSVIASLPSFAYYRIGGGGGLGDSDRNKASSVECSVCLNVIEEGEIVRLLPNCMHLFHRECVDVWLSLHATCPVCRANPEPMGVAIDEAEAAVIPPGYLYVGGDTSASAGKETPGEVEKEVWSEWLGRKIHRDEHGGEDLERQ